MKRLFLGAALAALLVAPSPSEAKRHNLLLKFGQDVQVAKNGPVSVRAQCLANDGGFDRLRVYLATTSPAVSRGGGAYYTGNGVYLMPGTLASIAWVAQATASPGTEVITSPIDVGMVLDVATQVGLAIRGETMVMGVNSGGDDCILSADIIPFKRFKEAK